MAKPACTLFPVMLTEHEAGLIFELLAGEKATIDGFRQPKARARAHAIETVMSKLLTSNVHYIAPEDRCECDLTMMGWKS